MPLYEYQCACGSSQNLLRPIAVRDAAVDCDRCGAASVRTVSAPRLAVLSSTNRRAHERNEKSAHEPRRYTRPAASDEPVKKQAAACSHSHHQGRPWMLGH